MSHDHHHHDHEHGCSCSCCTEQHEHHHQHSCECDSHGSENSCSCGCGCSDEDSGDPDSHHLNSGHHHHDGCSCGHDHHGDSCGCGHEHHHEDHGCSCGHDHHHGDSCGCGHDHDHSVEAPFSKPAAAIGAAIIVMSFILPFKSAAAIIMAAGTLLVGYPLFVEGIKGLLRFSFDELGLLTIAVAASFGLAAVSADPFEAVTEAMAVTVLFRIGNRLEAKAVAKSRRDIEALTDIRPDTATLLLADGSQRQTAAETVLPGSMILLKAGDRVPIDCEVVSGTGYIDVSAITGEPLPQFSEPGSRLLSGSINTDGLLTCRTVASFEDSAASRIIKLVRESAENKGSAETLISRFAKIYTPTVVAMAAALAVLPPLMGFGSFGTWLSRALVFLVASCPCALVISVPLTFFAGIGMASREGILVKGSLYLEKLAKADCIAFDKTGTITLGTPTVQSMTMAENSLPEERLLDIAAAAERNSSHPAAKAVMQYVGERTSLNISEVSELGGMGVKLRCEGDEVLCGSYRLMQRFGVKYDGIERSNIYLAVNGEIQCGFTLHDELRPRAAEAVKKLKELGFKTVAILTGDSDEAAKAAAKNIGTDTVFSQLLPEQKPQCLNELRKNHNAAIFVGDGINDAPVLAQADIGVAMGLGTDAAIEAADVVLVSEQLTSLPKAVTIARKTVAKANQNIVFALAVKAVVLLLGAIGMASMWMAVFADVGVSILAVLNSLTLLRKAD